MVAVPCTCAGPNALHGGGLQLASFCAAPLYRCTSTPMTSPTLHQQAKQSGSSKKNFQTVAPEQRRRRSPLAPRLRRYACMCAQCSCLCIHCAPHPCAHCRGHDGSVHHGSGATSRAHGAARWWLASPMPWLPPSLQRGSACLVHTTLDCHGQARSCMHAAVTTCTPFAAQARSTAVFQCVRQPSQYLYSAAANDILPGDQVLGNMFHCLQHPASHHQQSHRVCVRACVRACSKNRCGTSQDTPDTHPAAGAREAAWHGMGPPPPRVCPAVCCGTTGRPGSPHWAPSH